MKAHRRNSGTVLLIIDLGARGGWVVNARPGPLYPRGKSAGTHSTWGWVASRARPGSKTEPSSL